jgi:hypothetical protein
VHGSFVLGFALVGGVLAGEAVDRLRERADGEGRGWSGDRLGGLGLALAAMALASLANPRGIGISKYVVDLLRDVPTQRFIFEWQPPTPSGLVNVVFFASVLALLVVWGRLRLAQPARDVVLVCALLWLAWNAGRYVMWFGVVAMPVLAAGFGRLRPASKPGEGTGAPRWATAMLAVLLVLPVVLIQPWFRQGQPLLVETPITAAEHLRAHPGGRLFNEKGYASYLIWALPEQPVFIDTRLEMYPLELVEDYRAISEGWNALELLDRYGADRVLLSRQSQAKLSQVLAGSGLWQREYVDSEAEIWRR